MGYSWIPIDSGDFKDDAHIDELQTNINDLYSQLSLPSYGWSELPVDEGDSLKSSQFQELRNAADYADDQNYCRSHNSPYCSSDETDYDSTIHSDDHGTYLSGVDTSVQVGHNAVVDGSYDAEDYVVHCSNALTTNHVNHFYSNRAAVDASVNSTFLQPYNGSVHGSFCGTVNSGN